MKISPAINVSPVVSREQVKSNVISVDANNFKSRATPSFGFNVGASTDNGQSKFVLQRPKLVKNLSFSNPKQAEKLAGHLSSAQDGFKTGMLLFGSLISSSEQKYKQEIRHHEAYKHPTDVNPNPTLDIANFQFIDKREAKSLTLTIKTESGGNVTFTLNQYKGHGMAITEDGKVSDASSVTSVKVDFLVDGELSDEEKQQLADLSNNLEVFSNAYFQRGKADFKALKLNQFDVIESLELRAKGSGGIDSLSFQNDALFFKYENTENNHSFKAELNGNKVEMLVSKTQPFLINQQGRQQALNHYLALIEESKEKSKGSDLQINMMKDMFELALSPTKAEAEQASIFEKQREAALTAKPPAQLELSKDAFIPLPDFIFSFKSYKREETPEDLEDPKEKAEFDLNIRLQSTQSNGVDRVISEQNQHFKLKGFYRKISEDKTKMTTADYNYEANKKIRTVIDKGQLISATTDERNISDVHMKYYKLNPDKLRMGDGKPMYKLDHSEHTIKEYKDFDDISRQLLEEKRVDSRPLELLKELIIKPFAEGQIIYYKRTPD